MPATTPMPTTSTSSWRSAITSATASSLAVSVSTKNGRGTGAAYARPVGDVLDETLDDTVEPVDSATTLPVQQLYIGGRRVDATSDETFRTVNPATGKPIADVQQASPADVDAAVESARSGQRIWAATPAKDRARILQRAAALLFDRNDELARLETLDTGKPISGDVDGRHRHRCRGDRVLRRARPGDPRRLLRSAAVRVRPGAARTARRVRRHRRVELPDPDRDVEVGAGARVRQRDGVQAGRGHAAVGAAAGRDLHRGRRPRRCVQRRAGRRQGRSAAHPPSPHRQGLADRRGGDRQDRDGRCRVDAQARHARARRQVATDRVRRRRSRVGGVVGTARQLLLRRRGVLERHPGLRATRHLRRVRLAARATCRGDEGRRSVRPRRDGRPAHQRRAPRQGRVVHRGRPGVRRRARGRGRTSVRSGADRRLST